MVVAVAVAVIVVVMVMVVMMALVIVVIVVVALAVAAEIVVTEVSTDPYTRGRLTYCMDKTGDVTDLASESL